MTPQQLPIVYISPYYKPGFTSGANRRFDEICKRLLRDRGSEFTLIVAKGCTPHWWTEGNLKEVDYEFNHQSKFVAAKQISDILDSLPPSIAIVESIPIPFRALRRHVHFQVAYDFRYFKSFSKSFLYRLFFSPYLKQQWGRSEFMVTPTEFSISELAHYVHYPRERVLQSYFGIDENLLDPAYREPVKKTIDVLYVSHFDGHKNHAPLLRAIALIDKNLKLTLIGQDNGKRAELETLARELGLTNVTFDAINDDKKMWQLYRSSRVFSFPSLYEGFGMPLIEALSLGVPTTCSDIPVFREIGGDLVTYYDPNDPEDIARVVKAALENGHIPPLDTVKAHVERFTWNVIYKKFVEDLEVFVAKSTKKLS
ncbi:MAG TPA: glycosyltransferase family 1 protein [Candidatus Paceibacterota bacterium]